jgi:DNA-binding transcriptional ArsR family regulator
VVKVKRPWSLLSTHGLVLATVYRFGDLTVSDIGQRTGLGRTTVLRALQDLENAGMLEARRQGRRNVYTVNLQAHYRHPIMKDKSIKGLLETLATPAVAVLTALSGAAL